MLKPENVPDEVWAAFHEAVLRYGYKPQALAAALNAWPGMEQDQLFHGFTDGTHYFQPRLILPLTQEASDDQ